MSQENFAGKPQETEASSVGASGLPWQDAFVDEKTRIQDRRNIAFEMNEEVDKSANVENLTGLALSGGGIRSALFNDGFLQALSHRGLLRYVDYLSTVSGGGYIGGHLISCGVLKNKRKTESQSSASENEAGQDSAGGVSGSQGQLRKSISREKNFHRDKNFWELGKDPTTGRVNPNRLPNVGEYLSKSATFVTRYFTTQIFVFFLYFGIVGIIATLAALFWRSFDHEDFRLLWGLYGLNQWGEEVSLAFYPTIWLISIWLLGSLLRLISLVPACASYFETTGSRVAAFYIGSMKVVGVGIGISILIGVAVVMGNGITNVHANAGDNFIHLNRFAEILAVGAAIMQLLVFFGRDKLFRSEQAEAATWQKLLNKALSVGVVLLLFFALVHWMARENISDFTLHRDPDLIRQDVKDWKGLIDVVGIRTKTDANETTNVDADADSDGAEAVSSGVEAEMLAANVDPADPDAFAKVLNNRMDEIQCAKDEIISKSSWQRYRPGALPPDSPNVLTSTNASDFSNLFWEPDSTKQSKFVTNSNILSSPINFLKLSATFLGHAVSGNSWFGNGVTEYRCPAELKPVAEQTVNLRQLQRCYLRQVNHDSLNTAKFTKHLIGIGETKEIDRPMISDLLKEIVKDDEKRKKMTSRIFVVLNSDVSKQEVSDKDMNSREQHSLAMLNRDLLELIHPNVVKNRKVASTNVVVGHDQNTRFGWLGFFTILFLLGFLGTCNLNWQNSIFHYYRRRLNQKFLQGWFENVQATDDLASVERKHVPIALSECDITQVGLPYPLMLSTWMQRKRTRVEAQPFLFTPDRVGITDRNEMIRQDRNEYVEPANQYELAGMNRKLELADAVAMSGSAVTPLMTHNRWLAMLLDFFGVGLGQWLRRPTLGGKPKKRLIGYWTQFIRYLKKDDSFGFVADGGYMDVLGAYELLRRKCELIIVSDACCNTNRDELGALAMMLETANTNLGIQFFDLDHESPIDYGRLLKDENSNLPQNHIMMRVRYPKNEGEARQKDGLLIYSQMGITEQDPIEIRQIKNKFPAFPDEPTTNQFYTQDQVAAYQKLGYYIGEKICRDLVRWEPEDIGQAEVYRQHFRQESFKALNREYYGSSDSEFWRNFSAGSIPGEHNGGSKGLDRPAQRKRSLGRQPLFDVIKRRLLTSYRLACYEEDDYQECDIFSEAVWDRNEWCFISFKSCVESLRPLIEAVGEKDGYEAKLNAIEAVCLAWVRMYQTNADICAVYRNLVFLDVNGGMLSTEGDESKSLSVVRLIERELGYTGEAHEFERAIISSAHFGAVAIACQQFHRGIPRAIFQVGGREKLMDLAASLFLSVKKRFGSKQLKPEMPPGPGRPKFWWQWLESNCPELIELKTGVFNNAQVESTVSFAQVLILHLKSLQNWKTPDPPNTVLIRKRIFDAVSNFGIGDDETIKGLDQIVSDLFGRRTEGNATASVDLEADKTG